MSEEEWIDHYRTRDTETLLLARTFVYSHLVPLIDQVLAERKIKTVFDTLKAIGY